MTTSFEDRFHKSISSGTAGLVVLATVAASSEPLHGYEIGRRLADQAPEGLSFKQGTLYPMLRNMEEDGLLSSTLQPSPEGPARKCFSITAKGLEVLEAWTQSWTQSSRWVNRILGSLK
ncbi:MAG: PadR family transcriptional regulator [Burkholderiaceae bacterium]